MISVWFPLYIIASDGAVLCTNPLVSTIARQIGTAVSAAIPMFVFHDPLPRTNPTVLPQNTPVASPTGSAGIKASFKRYDDCRGNNYAMFTVVNIGGTPLRSAYIKVTDLKTGLFSEWEVDAFDLWQGCIIAQNYAPLGPGATGYLRSEQFAKNPRGDKMRAVIHACTQKSLLGFCVDTSVLFQ